jgi:hypothetical protein
MWPFSRDKKPVKLSDDVKAKYAHASIAELKKNAVSLKDERDHPSLTMGEHLSSLAWGTIASPESLIGQIAGLPLGSYLSYKSKSAKYELAVGVGVSTALGAVLGLNAYRRYTNTQRADRAEEKKAELGFVEKLITEREVPVNINPANKLLG